MSLRSLLTQTATLYRRVDTGDIDEDYGDPEVEDSAGVEAPCRLEPLTEQELTVDRNTQIGDFRLFLLPDAAIDGTSRVEVDAVSYEVLGPPRRHTTPRGPHHIELHLRLVEEGTWPAS